MEQIINKLTDFCTEAGGRLLLAAAVWFIGRAAIRKLIRIIRNSTLSKKTDPSVRSFAINAVQAILYVILAVSVVSILGVPMASVITLLASAGVAVGMSLQGALGNLAGGIMLIIFRPFRVGDYISAADGSGTVKEISLFYTVLTTFDNVRVIIPNGTLMNANITNYTAEKTRRVDLAFTCAKGEDIETVRQIMLEAMKKDERVLREPEPFARLKANTNEAMEFTVRAWVNSKDYWDVYFDLTQKITDGLVLKGISQPAFRIISEAKQGM